MNKSRQRLAITSLSIQDINRSLSQIERRLDQLEGINQNSDLHGGEIINVGQARSSVVTSRTIQTVIQRDVVVSEVVLLGENSGLHYVEEKLSVLLTAGCGLSADASGVKLLVPSGYGLQVDASGIKIKVEADMGLQLGTNGVSLKVEADKGLSIGGDGLAVQIKANSGLDVDGDGLALKQQSAIADVAAASALTLNSGGDQVDRAAFNTALAALVVEINAIRAKVNDIIAALEGAEVIGS